MPSEPPPTLEAVIAFLVPPPCREEVLGDLREKYESPGQYVALAMSVIPFVIVSGIRRTSNAQVLLMEALLAYASYLAAAWYAGGEALASGSGLLRLAFPAVSMIVVLMLDDAWSTTRARGPWSLVGGVAFGVVLGSVCLWSAVPLLVMLYGAGFNLVLVSAARVLFQPGPALNGAVGLPMIERPPAAKSSPGSVRHLYWLAVAIAVIAIAVKPGIGGAMIVVVLVIAVGLIRPGKE
jgi:hypothetical protein